MARLVNMFHLAIIALDVDWWGEWVPSKANVADLMTRPDDRGWQELEAGLTRIFGAQAVEEMKFYDMELPPLGDSIEQLKAWYAMAKAGRSRPKLRDGRAA